MEQTLEMNLVDLKALIEHYYDKADQYLEMAKKTQNQGYVEAAREYAKTARFYKEDKETVQDILNHLKKGDIRTASRIWYNLNDEQDDFREEFPYWFKQMAKAEMKKATQEKLDMQRKQTQTEARDHLNEMSEEVDPFLEKAKQGLKSSIERRTKDTATMKAVLSLLEMGDEASLQKAVSVWDKLDKVHLDYDDNWQGRDLKNDYSHPFQKWAWKRLGINKHVWESKTSWGKERLNEMSLGELPEDWFLVDSAKEDYENLCKAMDAFPGSESLKKWYNFLTQSKSGRMGLSAKQRLVLGEYLAKAGIKNADAGIDTSGL